MVRITVWRQPELSGEFEIAADGTVTHPLYREVEVAGVPVATAEARLREFLQRFEANPEFVVQPLFRVAVGGEVRQPSLYAFPPAVTLARAVALAGGPSERGRLDEVLLVRDGRTVEVDLTRAEGGLAHTGIRSGDQIMVSRRSAFFRDYMLPAVSLVSLALNITTLILRF